jgi:N-acylglucosamine 2-epimerase
MSSIGFRQLAQYLQEELYDRVVPFWLRHGVDRQCGGLLTCLDEEGQVLSTDKYLWSQTRALWVFATLAARRPCREYRELADALYDFCVRFGRNPRGQWVFCVSRHGEMRQDADSIYTDGFALLGLSAYFRLTQSLQCRQLLQATYESVGDRLSRPGSYGIFPYELPPGAKAHGVAMLFSLAFWEAGLALDDSRVREHGLSLARDILDHFVSEHDQAIVEFLDLENRRLPGPIGQCCLPGHAFESMWALIHIFSQCGRAEDISRCGEILRWHLLKGWDDAWGGIYLAIDLAGATPYWRFADYKPWWPAVEAMYALLLAYAELRGQWCLDWYQRVHNYAFTHYPVRPNGEWRNRLDRRGQPVQDVIALPVKDPFHLPRALIYAEDVLRRLSDEPALMDLVTP